MSPKVNLVKAKSVFTKSRGMKLGLGKVIYHRSLPKKRKVVDI